MNNNNPLVLKFQDNIISHPYATNDFSLGLYPLHKKKALGMAYIQANPSNSVNQIVLDLDYDFLSWWVWNASELKLPTPNLAIINSENGHAHLVFMLNTPVHMNWNSSQKAIRYLSDIEKCLSCLFSADAAYNGLLVKNPLNEHWETLVLNDKTLDLNYFQPFLDTFRSKQVSASEYKLDIESVASRNCALFDTLRHWAYSNWRKTDPNTWVQAVLDKGLALNQELYINPLGYNEVKATAKSIANYCISKFTKEQSMAWNKLALKKSHEAVARRKQPKIEALMKIYVEGEISIQECANILGISLRTAHNYLKEGREQERLKNSQPSLF